MHNEGNTMVWRMKEQRRKSTSHAPAFLVLFFLLLLCPASNLAAQRWHASAMRVPPPQAAQPLEDMAHMSWTRRDGAPSDISSLTQTEDGYLWIGSTFGLFRFDGLRFQPYPFTPADPRLPSSNVAALAADHKGGLWVGYRMGGISYLRNGTKIDYDEHNGLVSQSTEQLLCRDDGSVWATADGRILRFTGSTWENYSAKHGLASEGLFSLFFDRDNNLWTADKGHIYELKHGEETFALIPVEAGSVNQFTQLPNGELWISDAWKDVRPLYDDQRKNAQRIPGVPMLLVDRDDSLWLANEFGGITRIKHPDQPDHKVEFFTIENGLSDGQTRAILQDRQGSIWIGTVRGLDRFRPTPLVPFHGIQIDYFPALVADRKEGIWLHDMDKPLMRLQHGKLSFISEGHGSSSLFQDTDGSVWLLDQITRDFYRYPETGGPPLRIHSPPEGRAGETWCLGKDPQGNLLACLEEHGLWRYNGKWERVPVPGVPADTPLSLKRTDSGRVWLGYPHNQIVLEDATGFHTFGLQQGLELNSIFSFLDSNGLVLAGGSDGLASFDGTRFHSLELRTPGLLRGISGIVLDRAGDVWLNTGNGIIRLPHAEWQKAIADPSHLYRMDFQFLNEQDGLLGTPAQNKPTPSAVIDTHGILWFATSGHLVSIDPAQASRAISTPKVLLDSVVLNGATLHSGDGRPITEGSRPIRTLEFDYIGVDLNSPDQVLYQYMLEGQDKEWQQAGHRRQAFYTNLPPGTYRFRVRAATGTGPWSELDTPFQLVVKPPFYRTTWFYSLCSLPIFALLWLIYGLRVQHLTARMRERIEERAQERMRIARDLHDTLLQGVQGLVLRFHFATEQLPAEEPMRATLRAALDQADQVITEGREKVRQLRAEATYPGDLEKSLRRAANALTADGTPTRITVVVLGEAKILSPRVQDELYAIGREALTNAIKHAQASQIDLELIYERKHLRLRCADNGCGVALEKVRATSRQGHWGILGMRERAHTLGCKLEFSSVLGSGTEVSVSVEARKAYVLPAGDARWSWLPLTLLPRISKTPSSGSAGDD